MNRLLHILRVSSLERFGRGLAVDFGFGSLLSALDERLGPVPGRLISVLLAIAAPLVLLNLIWHYGLKYVVGWLSNAVPYPDAGQAVWSLVIGAVVILTVRTWLTSYARTQEMQQIAKIRQDAEKVASEAAKALSEAQDITDRAKSILASADAARDLS